MIPLSAGEAEVTVDREPLVARNDFCSEPPSDLRTAIPNGLGPRLGTAMRVIKWSIGTVACPRRAQPMSKPSGPLFHLHPCKAHEVGQLGMAMLGSDARGVELDAVDWADSRGGKPMTEPSSLVALTIRLAGMSSTISE